MTSRSPCLLQIASSWHSFTPWLRLFYLCIHQDANLLHLVTKHTQDAGSRWLLPLLPPAHCWLAVCFPKERTIETWATCSEDGDQPKRGGWGQCWTPGMSVSRASACSGLLTFRNESIHVRAEAWASVVCGGSPLGDTMNSVGSGLTRACSMRRQNRMALPTSLRLWNTSVLSSAYSMMSFSWWWKNSRIPESTRGSSVGQGHC